MNFESGKLCAGKFVWGGEGVRERTGEGLTEGNLAVLYMEIDKFVGN